MNLALDIKKFLRKIVKLEFQTETGRYNILTSLGLLVIFGGLEIITSVKGFVWLWLFNQNPKDNTGTFLILMFIFISICLFLTTLSEKISKR